MRLGFIKTDLYKKYSQLSEYAKTDKTKIIVLGDSFSVEHPTAATTLLKARFPNVQFISLAGEGFGPEQYLEQLIRFGKDIKPDWVVLNYYVGNDLTDTLYSSNKSKIKKGLTYFSNYSYLLTHLRSLSAQWVAKRKIGSIENQKGTEFRKEVLNPFLFDLAKTHPDYLAQNLLPETLEAQSAWETNTLILKSIAETVRKFDSKLVIQIIPSTAQVNSDHFSFYTKLGFKVDSRFPKTSTPQKLMLRLCKEQGFQCYDLLPKFRERGKMGKSLYLPNDDHWNPEGDLFASQLMEANLSSYLRK